MKWTDKQVEVIVSNLLRAGVLASSVTILVGLAMLLPHTQGMADFHTFQPVTIPRLGLDGISLIWCGLWILIATPITRVVFSVVAFAVQRDLLYVGITLLVLVVLGYSLMFGS